VTESVAVAMFYGLLIGAGIGAMIMHSVKCKPLKKERPSLPKRISSPEIWGKCDVWPPPEAYETNPFKEQG